MPHFEVTYEIYGNEARTIAEAIRVEQTIEFPIELAPEWIQHEVVGDILSITPTDTGMSLVNISYDVRTTGYQLPQFLNVLWGNVSLFKGVRVIGLQLPRDFASNFKGPRFGIGGLRKYFDAASRPLMATAIKPMGTDSKGFAALASTLARAGFDIIKDDHSLANQPWAPWRERVARVSDAVNKSNEQTGYKTVYAPSLNLPTNEILQAAVEAKNLGAGALMMLPGVTGFDSMRSVADNDEVALPIMSHPSMLGSFVSNPTQGLAHGLLLGTIMRLAGADISVFPNFGGRFSFTHQECREITEASRADLSELKSIWVSPAGGMTLEKIPEMRAFYGEDITLLIGGALHRGSLFENSSAMRRAIAD
jgi:ribulose-bisphosphate carboxylase large chain